MQVSSGESNSLRLLISGLKLRASHVTLGDILHPGRGGESRAAQSTHHGEGSKDKGCREGSRRGDVVFGSVTKGLLRRGLPGCARPTVERSLVAPYRWCDKRCWTALLAAAVLCVSLRFGAAPSCTYLSCNLQFWRDFGTFGGTSVREHYLFGDFFWELFQFNGAWRALFFCHTSIF